MVITYVHFPTQLAAVESVLDSGAVVVQATSGNYWRVRRNGATKLWRTRPGHYRIPVKMGFRDHGWIAHDSASHHFRVAKEG